MTPIPPLNVNPATLSLEHHLLRVLNDAEPTTLVQAIARVVGPHRFPDFTALGTPSDPSPAALNAWERLVKEDWTRYVERKTGRGHVITGEGDARLDIFWDNQVIRPYLDALSASHGPEVAKDVARALTSRTAR